MMWTAIQTTSTWVLLFCASVILTPPARAATQPEELNQGRRLYESQCGSCHGPRGNGGKGANLAQPRLRRATDNQTLSTIIRRGIPGTEMPGSPLTSGQVSSIAAYVRTLGRVPPEAVVGDRASGEALYTRLDCGRCHTLRGRGGALGPSLDDIGARRSAAHLRQALLDPEAAIPTGFLQLRVVTNEGRVLTGVRVNEDTFSLQFRDLSGQFHSFWKDELDSVDKLWGRSPMPSYASRVTDTQTDDLVTYLVAVGDAP